VKFLFLLYNALVREILKEMQLALEKLQVIIGKGGVACE
jgi:hypothetical protein